VKTVILACICLLLSGLPVGAQPAPDGLPLDLAFARKQLRPGDRPAVSADGRWLAYEVFSAPNGGSPSPRAGDGVRTFVVSTDGGSARPICGEAARCWRPSWSPDSRLLAFYSDPDGSPQLWVYDVRTDRARRVSDHRIKTRLWPLDKPSWSPDGREVFVPLDVSARGTPSAQPAAPPATVAVFSTDPAPSAPGTASDPGALQRFLDDENNATLAALDVAKGSMRILAPAESQPHPSLLELSPDGRWLSYISVFKVLPDRDLQPFFDLVVVPAGGGARVVVDSDVETSDGVFKEPYLWTADAKHLLYFKGKRLWIADVGASGPGKPRLLDPALGPVNDAPFALTGDGRAVLVGLAPEGPRTYYFAQSQILAIVPVDGSPTRRIQVQGWPVMATTRTVWQPDPKTLHVVVNDETSAERSVLRIELETGVKTTVWRGRGRLAVAGTRPDGSLIVRFEDVSTPPDYFRFSPAFERLERLTRIEPRLDAVKVGTMESFSVTVPGFDGHPASVRPAVFLPPGTGRGSRLPTLVYFYSGAAFSDYAQDYGGGAPNSIPVQIFATRGYAVLFVDVPMGPMGKGGHPLEEITDAILPQVYRAAELGYTDVGRVAVIGHSYGAYSTAGLVTQSNLFRAGIAIDGAYDLPGLYGAMGRFGLAFGSQWFESGQGRMGTHPWADLPRYLANSPYFLAERVQTPLLLLHGRNDDTCPVQESEKMFNALQRIGRTAELAIYEGEGHVPDEWSQAHAIDASQRILAFLERHLTRESTEMKDSGVRIQDSGASGLRPKGRHGLGPQAASRKPA
jgi:dipeptidyl aminopeptidase/acylaminoacyl peptidase